MEQKKLTLRRRASSDGPSGGSEPQAPSTGSLRDQARGWGAVARESYEDCEKGSDAVTELHRRRNRPGQ